MKLYFPYHPTHSLVDESALVAYVFRIVFFSGISSERKPTFKVKTSFFISCFERHSASVLSHFCLQEILIVSVQASLIFLHVYISSYFYIALFQYKFQGDLWWGEKEMCMLSQPSST